jgi:hypothetical protein
MVLSALLAISAVWNRYFYDDIKDKYVKRIENSTVLVFMLEQIILTSYEYYLCVHLYPGSCIKSIQSFQKLLILSQIATEFQLTSVNL